MQWTQTDLARFVREIWNIDLLPWQMQDLMKFLQGGIYSYAIPTDHGKSMLLEIAAACRLVADPNRRVIIVKINDAAAREVTAELARRLYQISQLRSHGAPAYPGTKPMLRWTKDREGIDPWGIGLGFDIEGRHFEERNINHSVKGYALGSRDLQGKRGDTFIDDVERQEEANSEAYRNQLKVRVNAVLRTIESRLDSIWMLIGTPFHADSVYSYVTRTLSGITDRPFEQIHRPFKNPDGTYLWPERAEKVELHRRTMTKSAFAAAYELTPIKTRRMTEAEIEEKVRDYRMPFFNNEREVWDWLLERARSHCPPWRTMADWTFEMEQRMTQGLMFYVSWDPAAVGDWAIVTIACYGDDTILLRSKIAIGDTWEQILTVREQFLAFPSAQIMWESNAQQKAFADLVRSDEILSQATIVGVGTTGPRKNDDQVGLPAMVDAIHQGYFQEPWLDQERAMREFTDLEEELSNYSDTSHPHGLPAIWFAWRWHRLHVQNTSVRRKIAQKEVERRTETVKIMTPKLPTTQLAQPHSAELRQRTREAWRRRA